LLIPPVGRVFWDGVLALSHATRLDVWALGQGLRLFEFWR